MVWTWHLRPIKTNSLRSLKKIIGIGRMPFGENASPRRSHRTACLPVSNVVLQKQCELALSHVTCSWPFVISVHDRSWPVFMTVHDPLWVCLWSFMSNFYTFEYMPHPRMVHICVFNLYYISLVSKYVEWIYDGQNSIVQLFTQANDHNENQIKCPLLTTCLPHICFFIVLVYHKDTW